MKKIQGIYKIRNLLNGKVYIGQSINFNKRFSDHRLKIANKKYKHPLYDSMRCYGIENFEFIVLEWINDVSKLNEREQYWMDYYQSYTPEFGYNIAIGAIGVKHSEETRKKLSDINKGKRHSDESKKKMSLSHKGKIRTEEHRKHLSEAMKGKKKKPHSSETRLKIGLGNKGKIVSEETRSKIARSEKGKIVTKETRLKQSLSHLGKKLKPFTEEHRKNLSLSRRNKK